MSDNFYRDTARANAQNVLNNPANNDEDLICRAQDIISTVESLEMAQAPDEDFQNIYTQSLGLTW